MKFYVMNRTGHTTIELSRSPTLTPTQKAKADKLFAKMLAAGMTAATRKAGTRDYTVIRDPNQVQDETLFVPRLKGG